MPVEIAGFAQALTRCLDFDLVEPPELERVLGEATEPLEMQFAEPSADSPLIRSGSLFTHMLFAQHGTVVPWQYPYSELEAPFLIGEHEFLMDAERWVASYSAVTEATVVWIPVGLMRACRQRDPQCGRADARAGDAPPRPFSTGPRWPPAAPRPPGSRLPSCPGWHWRVPTTVSTGRSGSGTGTSFA